jgi:hypothetical protein
MFEAYMITFLACSTVEPLRCKPIQILTDQVTPIGCVAVSQQLTAVWQSDPCQKGRWFGITFTPKQIHLDKKAGKLYWCDREGMRVMRSNLDGSKVETLVEAGRGDSDRRDQTRWCVGITIDPVRGHIYWTQKGPDNGERGRLFRAAIEISKGETPASRSDIEIVFDNLPEPIDLELDLKNRVLYWTDRGDPPRGSTVNRASIDAKPKAPEIVLTHLMEGIGYGTYWYLKGPFAYSAPEMLGYQLPYAPRDSYRNGIREVNPGCSKTNANLPKAKAVENIGARA